MARRSAELAVNGTARSARPSGRFLAGLMDASSVAFVSHIHPDPDSLGAMLGLALWRAFTTAPEPASAPRPRATVPEK